MYLVISAFTESLFAASVASFMFCPLIISVESVLFTESRHNKDKICMFAACSEFKFKVNLAHDMQR